MIKRNISEATTLLQVIYYMKDMYAMKLIKESVLNDSLKDGNSEEAIAKLQNDIISLENIIDKYEEVRKPLDREEVLIIDWIIAGCTGLEIASRLGVSQGTVYQKEHRLYLKIIERLEWIDSLKRRC